MTPRVLEQPESLGLGVSVYPSATAMVWPGEGHAHEADARTVRDQRSASAPLVIGHEQVGRVVALGRGGAKTTDGRRVSLGERVVWSVAMPCGRCRRCRRGIPQKCVSLQKYGHARMRRGWELSGGFATHTHILEGTALVAVPDDLPAAVLAPASCSTATVAAALDAAAADVALDGALVLIAGAGTLGLAEAAMATAAGARVFVSDPDPKRREAALAFGAAAVADPGVSAEGRGGSLAAFAKAGRRGAAPTVALEFTGAPSALRSLFGVLDVGGILVLVGSVGPAGPSAERLALPEQLARRLLTVRGVHDYAPHHLEQAVRFLAGEGRSYPFEQLVGAVFPLAEVDAVLACSEHPRVAVRP
ncbi:zinc-binding dehydrogenase [Leifsonia xyli]|uniref:zinc-binding dehydrogenase n=1 Tax=Leifsonia xyli TaxID=1575 RepID=UPI001CB86DB2|nr:zinc-binding dehydrogenase [Leifsonia xyli]